MGPGTARSALRRPQRPPSRSDSVRSSSWHPPQRWIRLHAFPGDATARRQWLPSRCPNPEWMAGSPPLFGCLGPFHWSGPVPGPSWRGSMAISPSPNVPGTSLGMDHERAALGSGLVSHSGQPCRESCLLLRHELSRPTRPASCPPTLRSVLGRLGRKNSPSFIARGCSYLLVDRRIRWRRSTGTLVGVSSPDVHRFPPLATLLAS